MTPKDLIAHKDRSPSVAYHKFVLLSGRFGNSVMYCFFEGKEDCPYYFARIQNYFDHFESIICNGKSNVIDLFLILNKIPKYSNYKMAYFIDRDFGPSVNIPEIYETAAYSIENFYCTKKCLSNILKNEFDMSSTDKQFDVCMQLFEKRQNEFHKSIILLNSWYCCVKNKARVQNIEFNQTGVCLNDTIPNSFVKFDNDVHITNLYDIDDLKSKYPKAPRVSKKEILLYKKKFGKSNMTLTLRGKYELVFMKKFLRFLITDANTKMKRNYILKKTNFNFQDDLVLSQLTQYADTPTCLKKYLASL